MILFLDAPTVAKARLINEARDLLDVRKYYLIAMSGRPDAIIVVRYGQTLESLANQRVDASIGDDVAQPGFCREEDVGKKRTKVTLRRVVRDAGRAQSLAKVLE